METKCDREYVIHGEMELTGVSILENLSFEESHPPMTVLKIGV